jgi:hypothetical protein
MLTIRESAICRTRMRISALEATTLTNVDQTLTMTRLTTLTILTNPYL